MITNPVCSNDYLYVKISFLCSFRLPRNTYNFFIFLSKYNLSFFEFSLYFLKLKRRLTTSDPFLVRAIAFVQ